VTALDLAGNEASTLCPARGAVQVTPSDQNELNFISTRLWIGGGGSVAVTLADGSSCTYFCVPAGSYLTIRARRVLATGTSATDIIAEY
jgi:hypothetical protein